MPPILRRKKTMRVDRQNRKSREKRESDGDGDGDEAKVNVGLLRSRGGNNVTRPNRRACFSGTVDAWNPRIQRLPGSNKRKRATQNDEKKLLWETSNHRNVYW